MYGKVKHFYRQNNPNIFSKTMIHPNEDSDKHFYIFVNSIVAVVLSELIYQMERKKRIKWYAVVRVVVTVIYLNHGIQHI